MIIYLVFGQKICGKESFNFLKLRTLNLKKRQFLDNYIFIEKKTLKNSFSPGFFMRTV